MKCAEYWLRLLVTVCCEDRAVFRQPRLQLSPPVPSLSPSSTIGSASLQPCPSDDRRGVDSKAAIREAAITTAGEKWEMVGVKGHSATTYGTFLSPRNVYIFLWVLLSSVSAWYCFALLKPGLTAVRQDSPFYYTCQQRTGSAEVSWLPKPTMHCEQPEDPSMNRETSTPTTTFTFS